MDASILVVGGGTFLSAFLEPIRDLAAFTVEVVADLQEAAPLIQAQQPDLLVIQASLPGSLDFCRDLKAQNRLAWIYCLLIHDDDPQPRDNFDFSVEAHKDQIQVEAIESGADACLWLSVEALKRQAASADVAPRAWSGGNSDATRTNLSSTLETNVEAARGASAALKRRLLQAQIRAGLRQVQTYRELMRTNDLLSAIALSDPLTELNNRRALEWELPRQIHNARSCAGPLSLLMLDVDYFKSINDNYGHLVGDRALKLLSSRLRHNLRFYDTPFRYGGEEFVIILRDTSAQEAEPIAQRLCRIIAEQPFNLNENLELTITISAGTASLGPDDDDRGISLLHRADQNLLCAKAQGRNRAVSG